MSIRPILSLACASATVAAPAAAQDGAFIVDLRLPARETAQTVFAWRVDGDVVVERSALRALGITAPGDGERVRLGAVSGLAYREEASQAAIIITCAAACFAPTLLAQPDAPPPAISTARGLYLNYDVNLQHFDDGAAAAALVEATSFGDWGVFEVSGIAQHDDAGRAVRLETRWTSDRPTQQIRLRVGDGVRSAAGADAFRFGGVEIGRSFALTPSQVTYPTPLLSGEASANSVVELYVDGALRARERVPAGPFAFDHAPLVSGAGEAQLVVTDLLGRESVITQAFMIDVNMLRPGLSDWSLATGAERQRYGLISNDYGHAFMAGRYRRGISNTLTLDGAADVIAGDANLELGATLADIRFGRARMARAQGEDGGATTLSWQRDGRVISVGAAYQHRDAAFRPLGSGVGEFNESAAANLVLNLGDNGSASLTAASVSFADQRTARTLAFSYAPDLAPGALSFRALYVEQAKSDLFIGLSYAFQWGDASVELGVETDNRGLSMRAGAQRSHAANGGFGWRTRAVTGAREHVEIAGSYRGQAGEADAQIVQVDGAVGARIGYRGGVGWIDGYSFVSRQLRGSFALVDVGVANIDVLRDRLPVGHTGRNGRLLVTQLQPYASNAIGVDARDLPFDRALAQDVVHVAPREGTGVVVRFPATGTRLSETRAQFADGEDAPRGAVLVRTRDGARFPIGRAGRVVLTGATTGDIVRLDQAPACAARADEGAAAVGLFLLCEAAP